MASLRKCVILLLKGLNQTKICCSAWLMLWDPKSQFMALVEIHSNVCVWFKIKWLFCFLRGRGGITNVCIPVHVSASYSRVHVSLSSVPALWHLGLLFPRDGSWSIPLELFLRQSCFPCRQPVRHPLLFSHFHLVFSSRFPIPPFFPLQSVAWAVLPPGVIIPASREGASCFLGKVFFCCLLGLCDLQETLINKQISPSKKENDRRREAQRHFWHLLESCSCLPGKGFYWMLCGFYYKLLLGNAVGIWALLQYPFPYPCSVISIINQVESSTCYPCPKGSLWFRRCVSPLISHIYIFCVVQGSGGRTRSLPGQEQKSRPWICRALGLKAGERKGQCLFFLRRRGSYSILQGISLANTTCRLEECHHCWSGSWGTKSQCLQLGVDPAAALPWLSCHVFSEMRICEEPDSAECRLQLNTRGWFRDWGEAPVGAPSTKAGFKWSGPIPGWNCSPWAVPRTGLVSLICCCSTALNLRERKSGCTSSCERSQWWQGNVI